jgi:hypothetical protein
MEVSGQLHAPAVLPPTERAPGIHWTGEEKNSQLLPGLEPPIIQPGLDMVSKRKIPSPLRESNADHPIVQPIASRSSYTGWAIWPQVQI